MEPVHPEGTKVTWKVSALATQNIYWSNETTRFSLLKKLICFVVKSIAKYRLSDCYF
jgi:hypothetical protein